MKPQMYTLSVALLFSLAACGGEDDTAKAFGDPNDFVNDAGVNGAGDAANENDAAYKDASDALRQAAERAGELACNLPEMPDSRAGNPANAKTPQYSYNSNAKPSQVYAFYRHAAEANGGSAQVSGPPGMADIAIALADGSKCRVIAQSQLSGDTYITVMVES